MKKAVVLLTFIALVPSSCIPSRVTEVKQGIRGRVLWIEGNQMPGPGRKSTEGKPVIRELFIYKVLKLSDLTRVGALFSQPNQEPILIVKTNEAGEFQANLDEGVYSILTREETGFFANSFDGSSNVMPVEVTTGNYTLVNISINYKAVY
ncbi:MAG: carboxypeptidase regulatory-like domain-containing protein [Bacteroidota bacterium]